jgi:hypothetical protein
MRSAEVILDENRVTRVAVCREAFLDISFRMPWNVKALAGITASTKRAGEGRVAAGA